MIKHVYAAAIGLGMTAFSPELALAEEFSAADECLVAAIKDYYAQDIDLVLREGDGLTSGFHPAAVGFISQECERSTATHVTGKTDHLRAKGVELHIEPMLP